jgi:intracellular sulfur oxidation DsrE/DsrF family protein
MTLVARTLLFYILGIWLAALAGTAIPTATLADDKPVTPIGPSLQKNGKYLFSVTLHTKAEIDSMLTRAETLAKTLLSGINNRTGIALVLHGPEIELFTKKNYGSNRQLVDKASRLDSSAVIDIKACRTTMGELKIKEKDLPNFIEIVPYGPDEEKRLLEQGYTYL